ncbi:hypothetical protein HHL28_10125 [Aerophototrophica crusticola]|uniref:Uncharacterized protein n=1 Tax=Aerophototrophica crusticola TaxID=1709002 RepID=A0A858R849_9PROT|nr:hypothetical protein HHL28_10125 [Rhodospirillaceae bacterium B3]
MANSSQQGTGKHPHKSAAEPYPHTKDDGGGRQSASDSSRSESHQSDNSRQSASGNDGKRSDNNRSDSGKSDTGRQSASGGSPSTGQGADDLKSREYKDADGNVHHHTRAYMEQHKGEK